MIIQKIHFPKYPIDFRPKYNISTKYFGFKTQRKFISKSQKEHE